MSIFLLFAVTADMAHFDFLERAKKLQEVHDEMYLKFMKRKVGSKQFWKYYDREYIPVQVAKLKYLAEQNRANIVDGLYETAKKSNNQ